MRGLSRYMSVLRLFDETHGQWTIPEMSGVLQVPASTVYATVRDMTAAGLLEAAGEANYRLGAAFIEFDRLTRLTDPLYEAGLPLLREVVLQARQPCTAVLARLYGDTVMCVADVASRENIVRTSYERGRPRPLTRGATSKVILAQVPPRRLKRLLAGESGAVAAGPFAAAPEELRLELRLELANIRKRGFCITRGEVDRGILGIAAPVVVPSRGLLGSLSLVLEAGGIDGQQERRLALLVISSAALLTEHVSGPSIAETPAPLLEAAAG